MNNDMVFDFIGDIAKVQKKYDICVFEIHASESCEPTITNGEWLYMTDPEKLLDTACGFDCALCACANDCTDHRIYCTTSCMAFKTKWLSSEHVIPKGKDTKGNAVCAKKHVRCIETGVVYDSIKDAGKQMGVSANGISDTCNGKQYTAGGLHWEFA